MKKRQNISLFPLLIIGLLMLANSCSKNDDGDAPSSNSTAVFNPNVSYGTMTDIDGNVYKTVTIGTQTWMAENLRTTKYNDGTPIDLVGDNLWNSLTTGAYCNYDNTQDETFIDTYGRLYNWHAVNTSKLAPTGWHVAIDADWTQLMNFLGGQSVAYVKLIETGTTHWTANNNAVTNVTGFTALPGGFRDLTDCSNLGESALWWSATVYDNQNAYRWGMNNFIGVETAFRNKNYGYSVRCVKN